MTPPGAVSKRELFLGFLKIGLLGFGGVAPWARHVIVEERCWLTDKELAALCRGRARAPAMSAGLLLQMAQTFAMLSLLSVGGINAVLPEVRWQVVDVQGWIGEPTFAALFAIAHAAPGPNIIMVSLIGWQLAGLIVAMIAMMLPSCTLAFVAARTMARWSDRRWVAVLRQGLVPVALGLLLATGITMLRVADHDRHYTRHQPGDRGLRRAQPPQPVMGARRGKRREHAGDACGVRRFPTFTQRPTDMRRRW